MAAENVEQQDPIQEKHLDKLKTYLVHSLLFILTFLTATLAGVQWLNRNPLELTNFSSGITYSVLILLMLAAHEFGHYTAARWHNVRTTLPFFLPFPSFLGVLSFGTLGAVIRIRSSIPSRRVIFDIGAAGPIAGFVASLVILIIGFASLPPIEYLYTIHPEYAQLEVIPEGGLAFGNSLFYWSLAQLFSPSNAFIPPMNEIYHYPFLCVGWFGMFVTAMNLIPIGQLDGGHISYAMFGNRSHLIGQTSLVLLVILGLSGFLPLMGIQFPYGWAGWLFWAFVLIFFLRAMKLTRAPVEDEAPLDNRRLYVGWVCCGIFVGSFSLVPFSTILQQ